MSHAVSWACVSRISICSPNAYCTRSSPTSSFSTRLGLFEGNSGSAALSNAQLRLDFVEQRLIALFGIVLGGFLGGGRLSGERSLFPLLRSLELLCGARELGLEFLAFGAQFLLQLLASAFSRSACSFCSCSVWRW